MKSTSPIVSRLAHVGGLLLVAAAMALSLPGVRAVRADQPDMTPVAEADFADLVTPPPASPSPEASPEACGDPTGRAKSTGDPRGLIARIPQPRPAEAGSEAGDEIVLLNNRGYNYGPSDRPSNEQWKQIERELGADGR